MEKAIEVFKEFRDKRLEMVNSNTNLLSVYNSADLHAAFEKGRKYERQKLSEIINDGAG